MTLAAPALTALSAAQLASYERDGYLILRDVFSREEIAALAEEADLLAGRQDLIHTDNIRCRWKNHYQTGVCTFECFDPVIDLGTVCGKLAHDPRLLDPLGAIYGQRAWLFKDKLIYKPAGTHGYDLHQDFISWNNFPETFVTVLIPIDASTTKNGCTIVYPGVHRQGYLSPRDGDYHNLDAKHVDESQAVPLELNPGDVALFSCFTPHRSSENRTNYPRRQLYLSYNADSDGGDRRAAHYREFHDWLRVKYAQYGKMNVYFQ